MDFHPSVTQKHVLVSLLFTGEEPPMSKITPALNVLQRKELVSEGFIELEKRARSFHVILTDRGWAWAFETFGEEVSGTLKLNAKALEGLLNRLKTYMVKNDVAIVDLLAEGEVLSPGKGQIPLDQVKSMDHKVIANSSNQFYGRANSLAAVEAVREQIRLRGGSGKGIPTLGKGEFYLSCEKIKPPIKVKVPLCLSHHPANPLKEEELLQRGQVSRKHIGERHV